MKAIFNFGNRELWVTDPSHIEDIRISASFERDGEERIIPAVYEEKRVFFFFKKKVCKLEERIQYSFNRAVYNVQVTLNSACDLVKSRMMIRELEKKNSIPWNPFVLYFSFDREFLPDFLNQLHEYDLIKKSTIKEN